ncbi:MAG: transcriptional repressor [Bacteroidales bacterium]|nr:transcriptional repressor [Bacteroidales bacterium]
MNHPFDENLLTNRGVKPTANRLLVLRSLAESHHPVSLLDLEEQLPTMDRSSIFRVLTTFRDHDVVHAIEDGSGSIKYELCCSEHQHSPGDMHVHFYCEHCQQTFCLEEIQVPMVKLPEGFDTHIINYMVKGLCPHCSKRHHD